MFWLAPTFAQNNVLRVGVHEQKPHVYLNADGSAGGIFGELLNEVAKREGWQVQVFPCSWNTCLQHLENGSIDLLPDVHFTEERTEYLDFHTIPALYSWSQIYALKGSGLNILQDLNGSRLAVLAGSSQYEYLSNLLPSLGIKADIHVVEYLEHGFDLVRRGVVDAVASDYLFGETTAPVYSVTATPIIFSPVKIYYAAPKGKSSNILNQFDRYLEEWQEKPDSIYYQILAHWQNPLKRPATKPIYLHWQLYMILVLAMLTVLLAWRFKHSETNHRRRLRISEDRLNTVLGSVDALIYIKDKNQRYLYANQKVANFFGVSIRSILKRHDHEFITNPDTIEAIGRSDQHVLQLARRITAQESIISCATGKEHIFLSVKVPLHNASGAVEGLCAILTDITDRVEAQEEARRMSFYDSLTDLPNRRMLINRLEKAFKATTEYKSIGALLYVNLDGFKKINETRGHDVGDSILRSVAQRLISNTRERDTVSRLSGDEFVVLLTRLGDSHEKAVRRAIKIAEKLRLAIFDEPVIINDENSVLSASIGVTMIHDQSGSVDEVMREASLALQRAKRQNANCTVFYEEAIQIEVEERLWLEKDLITALYTPQLQMYIQPQYSRSGTVTGAELLARWMHPERGFISPAVFIPLAEESGLINRITDWTLEVACETIKRLQAIKHSYPVSINMSPKRLMEANFVHYVRNLLGKTGVSGEYLVFEVTEGVWVEDIELLVARMNELNSLGIRFAVDDFGTGYSNLAYLNRLPLYELKVDKSLIKGTTLNKNSTEIIKLVLAMAQQLKLRVVAEGVELSEQADFLWSHQCDALQGYLMARPMPISEWISQADELPSGQ